VKTDNYRKNCLAKLTKNNQNQEAAGQKAGRSLKVGENENSAHQKRGIQIIL
jgi:hypothetical protein